MRATLLLIVVLSSCSARTEGEAPAKEPVKPAAPRPQVAKPADSAWTTFTNQEYGIRMKVPEPSRCQASEGGELGRLECDYGDFHVVVLAHRGEVGLEELRREAAKHAREVPPSAWQWRGQTRDENGYRVAEAWSAVADGHAVVGLVGQGAKVSHVVFLAGEERAWSANAEEIAAFVDHVEAL